MPGYKGLWQMNEADMAGQCHYTTFRKSPALVNTGTLWFDLSMSPGNPAPQYYAASPLVAQQFKQSTDGGIRHGSTRSGTYKFVKRFLMMSTSANPTPMPFVLCDYLLYYPFVDTGTNDEQLMTNSVSLPRFTDGVGVQMMIVSVAGNSGTSPTFIVSYVNQDGNTATTPSILLNLATTNGQIISSSAGVNISSGCFLPLASGDYGVRSVNSVTFTSGTDVGLFALVLVKPLMSGCLHMQTAPHEVIPLTHQSGFPQIYDDSYLNIICQPVGSVSGVSFYGELEAGWN